MNVEREYIVEYLGSRQKGVNLSDTDSVYINWSALHWFPCICSAKCKSFMVRIWFLEINNNYNFWLICSLFSECISEWIWLLDVGDIETDDVKNFSDTSNSDPEYIEQTICWCWRLISHGLTNSRLLFFQLFAQLSILKGSHMSIVNILYIYCIRHTLSLLIWYTAMLGVILTYKYCANVIETILAQIAHSSWSR